MKIGVDHLPQKVVLPSLELELADRGDGAGDQDAEAEGAPSLQEAAAGEYGEANVGSMPSFRSPKSHSPAGAGERRGSSSRSQRRAAARKKKAGASGGSSSNISDEFVGLIEAAKQDEIMTEAQLQVWLVAIVCMLHASCMCRASWFTFLHID
jgi:hypothetical protein